MDLFDSNSERHEPLAKRMSPRSLDEYIGQTEIIGKGKLLRRAIELDRLSSVIFTGPPGCGKTALAHVIALTTKSNFVTLNAVLTGTADIKKVILDAQDAQKFDGRRTTLFVDEVHRWNKAQQDALLPWVENGTITLIGATTENPYFEVNRALVSRSRIFTLKPLTAPDMKLIITSALNDKTRGYGNKKVIIDPDALDHLIDVSAGDARSLLNALELCVETTDESDGETHVTLEVAQDSIQQKPLCYDKNSDYHYDVISAFIKSLRGRDPDAALFWLGYMVKAGEDPHFIFRRLLISACEDTGLASPYAITIVESCMRAFDAVGLPEGIYFLTHATLFLTTSGKSNSAKAIFDAMSVLSPDPKNAPNMARGNLSSGGSPIIEVPSHLKDPSRDSALGDGKGYLYPHDFPGHWVAQQYLPDCYKDKVFYNPTNEGYEGKVKADVLKKRADQRNQKERTSPPKDQNQNP